MTVNKLLLTAAAFLAAFGASAQDTQPAPAPNANPNNYVLEITPGKKVLYVNRLNIAGTVSIGEILDMFPEFLLREGDAELNNYDIQVNGVSSGRSKEVIVEELKAADVEKIEISQSASTSQQRNGQGGVLDIILMPLKEGSSGSAMLAASTMWDVMPTVRYGYRKGGLSIRASLSMEYYNPINNYEQHYTIDGTNIDAQVDTTRTNNFVEMGKLHIEYQPNNKHKLKAWVWESYEMTDNKTQMTSIKSGTFLNNYKNINENNTTINSGAEYQYTYGPGYIKGVVQYEYNPFGSLRDRYNNGMINLEDITKVNSGQHSIAVDLKTGIHCVPVTPTQKCEVIVGVNTRFVPATYGYRISYKSKSIYKDPVDSFSVATRTDYVSPFVEVDSKFGPCFLKAGLRYQFFQYNVSEQYASADPDFSTPRHDYTAFMNFGWQVVPHHHLSLILDRALKRPDNQQVYPYKTYDVAKDQVVMGNENLEPIYIHNVNLNYIYDFQKGGHNLIFNTSVQYINTSNILANILEKGPQAGEYYFYVNDGTSNIISWNGMLMYSYGMFSMAFSANLFNNYEHFSEGDNKYFCYNLSFTPMLHLPLQWGLSAKFTYNSKVEKMYTTLGEYFYSHIRLSKEWNKWTFYAECDDIFHNFVIDKTWTDGVLKEDFYNLHRPCFALGALIRF